MNMNKPGRKKNRNGAGRDEAVLLEDLVPRDDVKGGAGKLRFGQERPVRALPEDRTDSRKRRSRED